MTPEYKRAAQAMLNWSTAMEPTPALKQAMYASLLQMLANAELGAVTLVLPGNIRLTRTPARQSIAA